MEQAPRRCRTFNGGITFQALTHVDNKPGRYEWAVGSTNGIGVGWGPSYYSQNMLFLLNDTGQAVQYPDVVPGSTPPVLPGNGARLITNIVPFAILDTSNFGGGQITGLAIIGHDSVRNGQQRQFVYGSEWRAELQCHSGRPGQPWGRRPLGMRARE